MIRALFNDMMTIKEEKIYVTQKMTNNERD
jgi:hypothetical protein